MNTYPRQGSKPSIISDRPRPRPDVFVCQQCGDFIPQAEITSAGGHSTGTDHCGPVQTSKQMSRSLQTVRIRLHEAEAQLERVTRELGLEQLQNELDARDPNLDTVLKDVAAWADDSFPEETLDARLAHLRKEYDELLARPESGEEMADMVMIIANHAHIMGVDLKAEIRRKLAINRVRTWRTGPDGVVEHVRDDE